MALNVSVPAAREYAKALIDIGEEKGELSRIYDELTALRELYDEDKEFRAFFTTPRLDPAEKLRILGLALSDKIGKTMLGLIHVLVRKRRELLLDNIADEFLRYRDLAEGKVHVRLRTARPVSDEIRERIQKIATEEHGKTAVIHETVEPELIGGMILRVGDIMVDGTIKRKLEVLRKGLMAKERLF